MKESESIVRILSARHVSVPLLALAAVASVSRAEVLRDPTQPAHLRSAGQTTNGALRIEAIFTSGDGRVAIINGQLVRAGGRIGNALIQEISADAVRYSRDGASHLIRLPRPGMSVRGPESTS